MTGRAEHAARAVEGLRDECLREADGGAVLKALHACLHNALPVPRWLADEFSRRVLRVTDACVGSWDEAFGRPWPKGTRLADVRTRRRQVGAVHAAVLQLASERMPDGSFRPINRDLFEEAGERQGIHVSGATAERRYREALEQGLPNAVDLRAAWLCRSSDHPS
ncbi:hypothetical protein [Aquabacterium sp.]|uniref:hypothetical protein n=1 Tax=Aquabacterium sp. TaxID=1872578 RepID=UPI0037840C5E